MTVLASVSVYHVLIEWNRNQDCSLSLYIPFEASSSENHDQKVTKSLISTF